jgi:hypothetical protein
MDMSVAVAVVFLTVTVYQISIVTLVRIIIVIVISQGHSLPLQEDTLHSLAILVLLKDSNRVILIPARG